MTPMRPIVLSFALALTFLAFVRIATGCETQSQALAVEATAHALATAGDEIEEAAARDAVSTCPDLDAPDHDACIDGVVQRWAPVDAAYDGVLSALGSCMLALERDETLPLDVLQGAWEALAAVLAPFGVALDPSPGSP